MDQLRETEGRAPGPLADEKRADDVPSDQAQPQPQAAEVESARLLANDARDALHAAGFDDDEINRLADRYIAEDRGEVVESFIAWARDGGVPAD